MTTTTPQVGAMASGAALSTHRGPQILVIEVVNNGYIVRDNRAAPRDSQFVERSVEQLVDRIRSILNEPFAPQDGG